MLLVLQEDLLVRRPLLLVDCSAPRLGWTLRRRQRFQGSVWGRRVVKYVSRVVGAQLLGRKDWDSFAYRRVAFQTVIFADDLGAFWLRKLRSSIVCILFN